MSVVFALTACPAFSQEINLSLNGGDSLSVRALQLLVIVTVLSLVPGIAIMVTCFPFMVTVFAILRQALGLQQSPPNMLIISLALFLTYFVMEPVFAAAWNAGAVPLIEGGIELDEAFLQAIGPFRRFMQDRISVDTFLALADLRPDIDAGTEVEDAPLSIIIPTFLLSEMERAFQVGFIIFLPFLIIDLVVAAVLMSMGMMMVPPAIVSLPFKLAFFVVADGWALIAGSLVMSYR
ncbi:flagellar biosynthetic protein FliP [Yoonia litorea]|uniref:Flagellar biosynthetic protein FliP n=1 Tax=Yoonia litorea TaxID=1123755 RepID=A0A1I6MUG7_9RHOB|nr:flagellar biosynthetic protein FliP [Yoonia litorea]